MSVFTLIAIVVALAVIGFVIGRSRSVARVSGDVSKLHSLPSYHGAYVLIWTLLPALALLTVWQVAQPRYIASKAITEFPATVLADPAQTELTLGVVKSVANGLMLVDAAERKRIDYGLAEIRSTLGREGVALASDVQPFMIRAAKVVVELRESLNQVRDIAVIVLALLGFGYAMMQIAAPLRARSLVETSVRALLIIASAIAILTTFGIVMSMALETLRFFEMVPPQEFFFGTVWDPGFRAAGETEGAGRGAGGGEFGLLPLLWGTGYISLIALLIAVPVGLFSAVYMSEFAGKRFRSIAKPLLEVLAGIPTIVYGFFALVTVGPFIRDSANALFGLSIGASSVLTAGVVMGIMIIPFVSSLSDDIINAVPQSLRDGSYGLGATKAETVRLVVLPAALPGIVGAVLLAASRAIGETMIVVLAAGATAKMDVNPFEAMTTVTVKIVTQLTGDVEFTSPQALVAFALGLTLFAVTLLMNIVALRIVRKYREQYE